MSMTVIVIRSLVPGGVADRDRRVFPGDRLVYVCAVYSHYVFREIRLRMQHCVCCTYEEERKQLAT